MDRLTRKLRKHPKSYLGGALATGGGAGVVAHRQKARKEAARELLLKEAAVAQEVAEKAEMGWPRTAWRFGSGRAPVGRNLGGHKLSQCPIGEDRPQVARRN